MAAPARQHEQSTFPGWAAVGSWGMLAVAGLVLVLDVAPGALSVYLVIVADVLALTGVLLVLVLVRPVPRWPTVLIALAIVIRLGWHLATAVGVESARDGSRSLLVAVVIAVAWWRLGHPKGSRLDPTAMVDTLLVVTGVVGSLVILELQDPSRGPGGLPGQSLSLLAVLAVLLYGALVRRPIPTASLIVLGTTAVVTALLLAARMSEVSGRSLGDSPFLSAGTLVPLGLAAAVLHPSYVTLAETPRDPLAAAGRWRLVAVLTAGVTPVVLASLVTPPSRDTVYLLMLMAGMSVLLVTRTVLSENAVKAARAQAALALSTDRVTGLRRLGDLDWESLPAGDRASVVLLSLTGWNSVYQAADVDVADRIERSWTQEVSAYLPDGAALTYAARGVYVAILPMAPDPSYEWAKSILSGVGRFVVLEGSPMPVDVRIGVAPLGEDGQSGHLRSVSLALNAMRNRPGGVPVATPELAEQQRRAAAIASELLAQDSFDQLTLVGLPMVRLADGTLAGLRIQRGWTSSTLGVIGEGELASVASRVASLHLQGALDRAVIDRVLRHGGLDGLTVAIPVDVRTLVQPGFVASVVASLRSRPSETTLLALRIRVAGLLGDGKPLEGLSEAVADLQAAGVTIIIDDLGAAAAALGQVGRMENLAVAIDRRIVEGIDADASRRRVVRMLVELAQDTDAVVVAAGVDTREQFEVLAYLGVDLAWGDAVGGSLDLDAVPPVGSPLAEPPALPALGQP